MNPFTGLSRMLAFQRRALRARAQRQAVLGGAVCFSAGFLAFNMVRNNVYSMLPDFGGQPETLASLVIHSIQALLFVLLVYIPALIVLSNAFSGDSLGIAVSRQEYQTHASALLPLWGLIFLIDAPLQYFAPHFLVVGVFGITIGMLALLILLVVYTVWSVKQLSYLSTAQAVGVFAVSWFTLPIYYLLTSFLMALPFFIMIPILYLGIQWARSYAVARAGERGFQQHMHALTQNPQDADAHYQLGLIHFRRGNLEVARRYFGNALRIDPAVPEYHYSMGRVCEAASEWAKALEQYEETYRLDPQCGLGDIFREVGKAYLHTGNAEKAIEFLRFFLDKRGSDPEGRYWMAVALQRSGNAAQMRVELNSILEQARANPRFFRKGNREWFYRARTLIRDSRFQARD